MISCNVVVFLGEYRIDRLGKTFSIFFDQLADPLTVRNQRNNVRYAPRLFIVRTYTHEQDRTSDAEFFIFTLLSDTCWRVRSGGDDDNDDVIILPNNTKYRENSGQM